MAAVVWKVTGMKCGGCENQVQDAVKACAGVTGVKASSKEAKVEIEYDDAQTSLDAVRKAIRDKGFGVE